MSTLIPTTSLLYLSIAVLDLLLFNFKEIYFIFVEGIRGPRVIHSFPYLDFPLKILNSRQVEKFPFRLATEPLLHSGTDCSVITLYNKNRTVPSNNGVTVSTPSDTRQCSKRLFKKSNSRF